MPDLLVMLNERVVARVAVTKAEMTVGRDTGCDVVIDNAGISRLHAVVAFEAGRYRIRDMDSENGIYVGGRRVRESPLLPDARVLLGKFSLELTGSDPDSRTQPGSVGPSVPAPRNVVQTVTIDSDQAARIQARLAAGRSGAPAEIRRSRQPTNDRSWLWWAAAAFVVAFGAALATRMFGQ